MTTAPPRRCGTLSRASNWNEFREAFKNFVAPQQNIVFADTSGEIGFIAPGRIPIRRNGNGWLPMPGWTGEYDWTGFIPFAELPQGSNPASGHFVSANNKIVPDTYPYFLSRDWDLPNRAERIDELLAADTAAIAGGERRDPGRYAVDSGAPPGAADEPHRPRGRCIAPGDRAVAGLGFPDGCGEVEPLLFTAWLRAFAEAVFVGRLGDAGKDYWNLHPEVIENVLTGYPEWCAVSAVSGVAPLSAAVPIRGG